MLHLQTGVHFEEVEGFVLTDHEFNRTGRLVLHGLGQSNGLLTHGFTGSRVDEGRWGFFDDLLVTALNRAITFVQVDHVAVGVTQHLDFDVARFFDKFFDEDAVIAEGVLGFVLTRGKTFVGFFVVERNTQTFTATAGRGLDHHRVADTLGDFNRLFWCVDRIVVTRNGIDLGFVGQLLRGDLVAHRFEGIHLRTDKDDAVGFELLTELGVFREETIARVNRFSTRLFAGSDDLVDHQIRFFRRSRADADGFVSQFDVTGRRIGFRVHGNGFDAHLAGSFDNATGDFAAVGNQDFLEHE